MRATVLTLLTLASLASLVGCKDRPGGLRVLSIAQCEAIDGVVTRTVDGGAEATCGSESVIIGRIDPDEAGGEDFVCCQ